MDNSVKLCECGCGLPTLRAKKIDKRRGAIQGKPNRFIHGHNRKNNICSRGHDINKVGRNSFGECKKCSKERFEEIMKDPIRRMLRNTTKRIWAAERSYKKLLEEDI